MASSSIKNIVVFFLSTFCASHVFAGSVFLGWSYSPIAKSPQVGELHFQNTNISSLLIGREGENAGLLIGFGRTRFKPADLDVIFYSYGFMSISLTYRFGKSVRAYGGLSRFKGTVQTGREAQYNTSLFVGPESSTTEPKNGFNGGIMFPLIGASRGVVGLYGLAGYEAVPRAANVGLGFWF